MAVANLVQSSERPPAQPSYVLRGHAAPIHAVHFLRGNSRLLTGDADGFVVSWSTVTKRPAAVWKPHSKTILGLGCWEPDRVITHGRDGKLFVWQLREADEAQMSTLIPLENNAAQDRMLPWLLHSLDVHTLNFCSFAMLVDSASVADEILLATPGIHDGSVQITSLPAESRVATIPTLSGEKSGMVMAIALSVLQESLALVAGYESGLACCWRRQPGSSTFQLAYTHTAHSQPILSLGLACELGVFFTSSADAIVARHPLHLAAAAAAVVRTGHAGQQSLSVRSDERIFATAGWDGRARVYSARTLKELAVLKWHTQGCYALAFAEIGMERDEERRNEMTTVAGQRAKKARETHWLALGGKDGKVSLWDVY